MKVLTLNAGSSSLKFTIYDLPAFKLIAKGVCERINLPQAFLSISTEEGKDTFFIDMQSHIDALNAILRIFAEKNIIKDISELSCICHMFVHGGKYFDPIRADKQYIDYLKSAVDYAPVHMPNNIKVVENCLSLNPDLPNYIYFDTGFHATIPEKAYTYAIDKDYTQKFNIRKYGFHGSSHEYMSKQIELYEKNCKKIITCHLGNGCSISAIKNGKCIDTSMGFTPLEGLVMGTRCGNIDSSIVCFLCDKYNLSANQVTDILNNQSGLLGLCGYSDLRDIENQIKEGNQACKLALDVYVYSIVKYIGSYICALQGVDAITFGGGVGENSYYIRQHILDELRFLGLTYDKSLNAKINRSPDKKISKDDSNIKVYVISINEEYVVTKKIYDKFLKTLKK